MLGGGQDPLTAGTLVLGGGKRMCANVSPPLGAKSARPRAKEEACTPMDGEAARARSIDHGSRWSEEICGVTVHGGGKVAW